MLNQTISEQTRKMMCPRGWGHVPVQQQKIELKSVLGGLFWQCPICNYMVRAPKEEADKIIIEAFSNALKKAFYDGGMPNITEKINVEELYYNPVQELKNIVN